MSRVNLFIRFLLAALLLALGLSAARAEFRIIPWGGFGSNFPRYTAEFAYPKHEPGTRYVSSLGAYFYGAIEPTHSLALSPVVEDMRYPANGGPWLHNQRRTYSGGSLSIETAGYGLKTLGLFVRPWKRSGMPTMYMVTASFYNQGRLLGVITKRVNTELPYDFGFFGATVTGTDSITSVIISAEGTPAFYVHEVRGSLGTAPLQDTFVPDQASIRITAARMISKNELAVTAKVDGSSSGVSRSVTVETSLKNRNGQEVRFATAQVAGSSEKQLVLNFEQANIPRFTGNQRIRLQAFMRRQDGTDSVATEEAAILLPVITIVGVTDNYKIDDWEKVTIAGRSQETLKQLRLLGEGYKTDRNERGDEEPYQTIYALSYSPRDALTTNLRSSVPVFRTLVSEIFTKTYAERVNITGYSFGGVSARVCVDSGMKNSFGQNVVRSVVTLCSPHTGTPWAQELFPGRQLAAKTLRPLWPSYRFATGLPFTFFPTGRLDTSSPQLASLSGMLGSATMIPDDVEVFLFYSDSFTNGLLSNSNPYLLGSLYTKTSVGLPFIRNFAPGDCFITADSQRGIVTDPNTGDSFLIPAFERGVALGNIQTVRCPGEDHSSVQFSPSVCDEVFHRLWKDLIK